MSAVISTLELLSDPDSVAEAERLREVALSSSRQMLYLLADIIEVSRSDGWNFSIQKEAVAISDVLAEIADAWRPLAEQRGLSLDLAFANALPRHVETDAKRLRQVIDNLVSNAVKFTSAGSLSISAGTVSTGQSPLLRIAVSDTGRGIGEAEQHRLFQEFSRISSQGELTAEGTGLGLSICKRIIESMGGRMGLESEPLVGSTFWLEVPCVAIEVEPGQDRPVPAASPLVGREGRRPKVLIADDVKSNRLILSMMLEKLGCEVEAAVDGQEALDLIVACDFDAVLLDDQMPRLRGGEVAQRIRAMVGEKRNIPILGATASTGEQEADALRDAGMDWIFAKPLNAEELRAQLSRLLV
jgi:CheY-like chemotaxis protein